MSTLSSLGVGSGLDVTSIISQLMTLERQPLTNLTTKEDTVKSKISAFGSVSSALSTLQDAATTLATPSTLAAFKANFADATITSGSASSTATAGTYSLTTNRLATTHKVASTKNFTDNSTLVGAGKFTLSVGSTETEITTSASTTAGDLRDLINNSGANVTANLVTGDSGTKLVLTAKDSGQGVAAYGTEAATILGSLTTVSGGTNTTLSHEKFTDANEVVGSGKLAINVNGTTTELDFSDTNTTLQNVVDGINNATPALGITASIDSNRLKIVTNNTSDTVSYAAIDSAADSADFTKLAGFSTSEVEIDGQKVTTTSNKITSAISGLTINLLKTGTTTLTVARDTSSISSAVDKFVSAYNALNSKIKTLTAYSATDKTGSVLTGDATIRSIQNQISSLVFGTGNSTSKIDTFADLGVSFSTDGSMTANSTKLQNAIDTDYASVVSTLGNYGTSFKSLAKNLTTSGGLLTSRTDGLNLSVKNYEAQRASLELRMTAIENRYKAQYTALDTAVASMQKTSSFLTQQLAKM
jgi:flagellar hook-associated protein 2